MYDELVKRLRASADNHHEKCDGCPYEEDYPCCVDCLDKMHKEAADAIEELSKREADMTHNMAALSLKVLRAEEKRPRWIPVTERLPEEYKDVLCYYEYFRFGEYNCMFRTIDRGYYGNGRWGGEAGQGIRNKVLAWMPLPQPPKED